jgi:type VI protein secretion system component VasK
MFTSDNNGGSDENGDRKKIWRSFGPKKNLTAAQSKGNFSYVLLTSH